MLVQKLLSGEITIDHINETIKLSKSTYANKISTDMKLERNRHDLLSFISDDIYEFDCITKYAKVMDMLGINREKWNTIYSSVRKYNNDLQSFPNLYIVLEKILKNYSPKSFEYKFIKKILDSNKKTGYGLSSINSKKFKKLNNIIESNEKKILTENSSDFPTIKIPKTIVNHISPSILSKFGFVSDENNYVVQLNKNIYTLLQKNLKSSKHREFIDDTLFQYYSKNIPNLIYLLIYKNNKAKMLDFPSYLAYLTRHEKTKVYKTLQKIILKLTNKYDFEMDIMEQLKLKYENDKNICSWDIPFYMNMWKKIYGVNESEISQYFEFNTTLTNIFVIINELFGISFTQKLTDDKKYKINYWNTCDIVFTIQKDNVTIGEWILDIFARENKCNNVSTICINNRCFYPFDTKKLQPLHIVTTMSLNKSTPMLLNFNDVRMLIQELGKIIYFLSCSSEYSIFGCMYSEVEYVDAFGKLLDMIMFKKEYLSRIMTYHDNKQSGAGKNDTVKKNLIDKLIKFIKLDYGISYKYQCLYALYDLYIHSESDFVEECKKIISSTNTTEIEKNTQLIKYMCNIYDIIYTTIFSTAEHDIKKKPEHFHPIVWFNLFNGNENINFLKILSDIYAHELFSAFEKHTSKNIYCDKLLKYINSSINQHYISINSFLGHNISTKLLTENFSLRDSDMALSVYDREKLGIPASPPEKKLVTHNSPKLYISPESQSGKEYSYNHYEQLSENNIEMKKLIGLVMK